MSSLFKRIFTSASSSSKGQPPSEAPPNRREENGDSEQKKKKLLRRLALAENDPEPLLDLSDSELTKLNEQILTLIKVYHKHRVHLERNQLPQFAIPLSSKHFVDVTVLHLEDNQLCSFQLDSPQSLANLKELYLGSNKLSTLPGALFQLPRLQVLSLRENRLSEFPLSLVHLAALTYCDLAYNRICTLPSALLSADPAALGTLIVEGNPLSSPPFEYLSTACQDVTSFAQIDACLRQYYQVHSHSADDVKKKKAPQMSRHNVDFAADSAATAAARSKGDDEDDADAAYNNEADGLFARYAQKKFESKQSAIEWERNYQNAQLEQRQDDTTEVARVTWKDKLLQELHREQDSLFAKINQFNDRKDAEKQRMLDNCIEQLQEHSSLLIAKLTQDIARQKEANCTATEGDLGAELNADIFSLLEQYDVKLSLKRNVLLNSLVENHQEEGAKLVETFQRKDNQHHSVFKELERHEESLSQAFDSILSARDRRNEDLSAKISLIEQELLALTFVERERRDERSDLLVADLKAQRTQLAQLLASLLEVKRHREKQLMETLEKELAKRYVCPNDGNAADSWLEEFQRLLSKESFEVQVNSYGIDARIADVLIGMYHELEDGTLHVHGSMLQRKLIYYLGHFVDLSLERLRTCSPSDLMRLNIDDYELCNLIVDKFREYGKMVAEATASDSVKIIASAPDEPTETDKTTHTAVEAAKEGGEKAFWCEAECCICLDNSANIVFLPCGHICTCQRCIRPNACPLSLCPLCRAEIDFMQSITS